MKREVIAFLMIVGLMSSCVVAVQPAKARSKTVSVPDDYQTISAAITNVADGDTVFVKKGTHLETLSIDKALNLVGEDKETTIINGHLTGTVVAIRHDNVNLTGFTVVYCADPTRPQPIWMWSTRLGGIHLLDVKTAMSRETRFQTVALEYDYLTPTKATFQTMLFSETTKVSE